MHWNMMQGKPPEITRCRTDDEPPEKICEADKDRMMKEAGEIMASTKAPGKQPQQQYKPKRVRVR